MKFRSLFIPVIISVISITAFAADNDDAGKTEKADELIATVAGEKITEGDVEKAMQPRLEQMQGRTNKIPQQFVEQLKKRMKNGIIDEMVTQKILEHQVEKKNIKVSEQEVMDYIKEIASQRQPALSVEDFKALVEANGQDFDEFKERVAEFYKLQKLMEKQWEGKLEVTDEQAKQFYENNKKKFENPEQVKASHILIKVPEDPNSDPNLVDAKAKAKAEQLIKQLNEGADFAELAKKNSEGPSKAKGGDLGFFGEGQMVPPFSKAAFALEDGQITPEPVKTRFGYHIIKKTGHKDAKTTSYEEAKAEIKENLKQQKQQQLAKQYIEKLKEQAKEEGLLKFAPGKEPQKRPAGGRRPVQVK